jgi:hypothetical protein
MSLESIFREAKIQAQRTQTDRPLNLRGGARLVVRVNENVVTLTIARKAKKVGDTELITFKRDCAVPDNAIRFPQEGQNTRDADGQTWWYVAFRWSEGVDQ